MVRLVIISDTHGLHHELIKFGELPEGDILIHAGDVSNVGALWDIENFLNWFSIQPFDNKCFIVGNHDFGFERERHACMKIIQEKNEKGWNVSYLEDSAKEIDGIKFWGSPITSPFMNWAFNKNDNYRAQLWDTIPNDVDVLITHGPPYDILDFSKYSGEHFGCMFLRSKVFEIKPIVHIFGHFHGEYGIYEENETLFINASTLNERYRVSNKPIVVDVDIENRIATVVS